MTLKDLVFAARQHIQHRTSTRLSTGHTYELLAAALRFNSYAELTSQAALVSLQGNRHSRSEVTVQPADEQHLVRRHLAIGAPGDRHVVCAAVVTFVDGHQLTTVHFSDLIAHYQQLDHFLPVGQPPSLADLDLVPTDCLELTLAMLEAACPRFPGLHYPLAQLYAYTMQDIDRPEPYWHQQQLAGKQLTGVQLEWAEAYRSFEAHKARFEFHTRTAAAAGNPDAILDMLEEFGSDRALLESLRSSAHQVDTMRAAEVALNSGRIDDAELWFSRAAAEGEIEAMRWLVQRSEDAPTVEIWTWVYLSRLLGKDICASTLRAYHDGGPYHGQEYDDDFGGALFVDGDEALDLPALAPELDRQAHAEAQRLFVALGE